MSKLPIISGRDAIRIFERIGYTVIRQKGSHIRLLHAMKKPLTIPDHKTLGKGLLRKLIRNADICVSDFTNLL